MSITIPNGGINLLPCRFGPMFFPRGDAYVGRSLELLGEYSATEVEVFAMLLRAGDVVVEAGANIGAHTVPLARLVGPAGRVIAFEPQRPLELVLSANVLINDLDNVVVERAAVGAAPGTTAVPLVSLSAEANFGGVSLGEGEPVPLVSIDSLALTSLRLLKVDVEGFEREVVEGAARTIRSQRPALYLENDRRHLSPDLIRTVRALDYRMWWHVAPFYTQPNFRQAPNPFGTLASLNMLCLPAEAHAAISGMREVAGDDDWPA